MNRWIVVPFAGPGPFTSWAVAKIDKNGSIVYTHDIPFPYRREADRAAARLNIRDGVAAA